MAESGRDRCKSDDTDHVVDPTGAHPPEGFWFETAVCVGARTQSEAFAELHAALAQVATEFRIDEALTLLPGSRVGVLSLRDETQT